MAQLLILLFGLLVARNAASTEEFSEELLLRPLPDGTVLSHFKFTHKLPPVESYGVHHRMFPKSIFQLVRKYRIRKMELTFTQGRWNYEQWGAIDPVAQMVAKPVGIELSASFDAPEEQVDFLWGNLTHALSGLFCASINFLESPTTFVDPWFSFKPQKNWAASMGIDGKPQQKRHAIVRKSLNKGAIRYGALPREAVCTENLTPWLKLLPCRDKAGLTKLLDRPKIYSGCYHSLGLRISCGDFDESSEPGTLLDQTLTLVLRNSTDSQQKPFMKPDWSLSNMFGTHLTGTCPLAKVSHVFVELEQGLVGTEIQEIDLPDNTVFRLSVLPDAVIREASSGSVLFQFDVSKRSPLDIGMFWKLPVMWLPGRAPFHVSRFFSGSGNAKGSISILLDAEKRGRRKETAFTDIIIFQMVPWYVRLYGHTLEIAVDGQRIDNIWDCIRLMRFTPAEDRKLPAALEIALRVPGEARVVAVNVEFDKGFLHIDEHPPDAARGFDLPSAIVTFPDELSVCKEYDEQHTSLSPLLKSQQNEQGVKVYSEVLLLQLATPDFSMPYNVITLTCTVLALYFGAMLNLLRRRVGEEERLSADEEGKKGSWLVKFLKEKFKFKVKVKHQKYFKLGKLVAIAGVAFAVNKYYQQ